MNFKNWIFKEMAQVAKQGIDISTPENIEYLRNVPRKQWAYAIGLKYSKMLANFLIHQDTMVSPDYVNQPDNSQVKPLNSPHAQQPQPQLATGTDGYSKQRMANFKQFKPLTMKNRMAESFIVENAQIARMPELVKQLKDAGYEVEGMHGPTKTAPLLKLSQANTDGIKKLGSRLLGKWLGKSMGIERFDKNGRPLQADATHKFSIKNNHPEYYKMLKTFSVDDLKTNVGVLWKPNALERSRNDYDTGEELNDAMTQLAQIFTGQPDKTTFETMLRQRVSDCADPKAAYDYIIRNLKSVPLDPKKANTALTKIVGNARGLANGTGSNMNNRHSIATAKNNWDKYDPPKANAPISPPQSKIKDMQMKNIHPAYKRQGVAAFGDWNLNKE